MNVIVLNITEVTGAFPAAESTGIRLSLLKLPDNPRRGNWYQTREEIPERLERLGSEEGEIWSNCPPPMPKVTIRIPFRRLTLARRARTIFGRILPKYFQGKAVHLIEKYAIS